MDKTKLKSGDRISCHIRAGLVVDKFDSDEYSEMKTFEIIGVDDKGYYVFVPEYFFIKNTAKVTTLLIKTLYINVKYLGDMYLHITTELIYKVDSVIDGCICKNCKDFVHRSKPNQLDDTFICYSCRNG